MKRINIGVVTTILATLFAISCNKVTDEPKQKEEPEAQAEEAQQPITRTFTFQIADSTPETKVQIDGTTGKTTWEAGDAIFIHGEKVGSILVDDGGGDSHTEYYSTVVTLKEEDIDDLDRSLATITITDDMTYMPYNNRYLTTLWAAYPASAVDNFSNGDEWFYWNRFKDTNKPLMTGFNNLNVNDGNTFKFYNLCGVISFVVSGDFDSYIFKGKHSETVGYGGYQCRVHVYDGYESSKVSDFTEKNIWNDTENSYPKSPQTTIEVTGWEGANGSKVNYICIPNGTTFDDGFTIQFLKSGSITHYVTSSSALDLTRSSLVPLGNITGKLKEYVDPRKNVTITPTDYSSSAAASAPGNKMTISEIDFYAINARKKSSNTDVVLVNNASVSIYNDTSLQKIDKIVINKGATTTMYNSFTVYGGTSSNPTSGTTISGVTTPYGGGGYSKITYDFSGGTYSHFAITYSSEFEGYCGDIEITYITE